MEGGGGGGGVGGGGRGGEREDGGVRRESVDADFAEAGGGGRVDAGEGWGFGRRGREFESEGFHNEANEGALFWPASTTSLASFNSIQRLINEGAKDSKNGKN